MCHDLINDKLVVSYRASTSLRDVCGGHSVQDLIENREAISEELHEIIGPIAKSWGVKVKNGTFSTNALKKRIMRLTVLFLHRSNLHSSKTLHFLNSFKNHSHQQHKRRDWVSQKSSHLEQRLKPPN